MSNSEDLIPQKFDHHEGDLPYDTILTCIGNSIVGTDRTPSIDELHHYMDMTNVIYKVSAYQHIVLVGLILLTIAIHIFRKYKHTCFQWSSLVMLIAQTAVGTITSINYSSDWDYLCNDNATLMYGLGIILFFQLNFLVSWKLYTATYDLAEFVIKH